MLQARQLWVSPSLLLRLTSPIAVNFGGGDSPYRFVPPKFLRPKYFR